MAPVRVGVVWAVVAVVVVVAAAEVVGGSNPYLDRVRRQIGGGDACMQIYTVPKQSVRCEPTYEVADQLQDMAQTLLTHKDSLDHIETQIAILDPDTPRPLPEEVQRSLEDISNMLRVQAAHGEFLKRLESEESNLEQRLLDIESSDRAEIARLIDTQIQLVETALHNGNLSLHRDYVDKLSSSAGEFNARMHQVELELRRTIEDREASLGTEMRAAEERTQREVQQAQQRISDGLLRVREELLYETDRRAHHYNETLLNLEKIYSLEGLLRALKQHQKVYEVHERELKEQVLMLDERLQRESDSKLLFHQKASDLEAELASLQHSQDALRAQLTASNNDIAMVKDELAHVMSIVRRREHLIPRTLKVSDCEDSLRLYEPVSGVYTINPFTDMDPFDVYCDMEDRSGWTVIQRRTDGSTDFFRGWEEYFAGFGDAAGEYWLGLERLHRLTSHRTYQLRVDMQDWSGKWWHAHYDAFRLDPQTERYRLHVSGYHGDAGDSLSYHNEMPFSTMDRNSDVNDGICATWCHGAWWYKDCFHSNLNGRYYTQGPYTTNTGWGDGVVWRHIQGTNFYSLKAVEMKIKAGPEPTPLKEEATN